MHAAATPAAAPGGCLTHLQALSVALVTSVQSWQVLYAAGRDSQADVFPDVGQGVEYSQAEGVV